MKYLFLLSNFVHSCVKICVSERFSFAKMIKPPDKEILIKQQDNGTGVSWTGHIKRSLSNVQFYLEIHTFIRPLTMAVTHKATDTAFVPGRAIS